MAAQAAGSMRRAKPSPSRPSGQRFTGWTVNEGGVTLADANSATTTFTMLAQVVTITANFENIPTGGGGGSSYTPTYPPTVEKPSGGGGAAEVSPSNPKPGDPVSVKPKPDEGYEVDDIFVTDKDGKPVEVTRNPDGTYTFKQPNGKVNIKVTYKPVNTPWNNPFTDVSESDWYYEAVRFVQENGLMNGYGNGTFVPNAQLSRAQLAQILFNKEGQAGSRLSAGLPRCGWRGVVHRGCPLGRKPGHRERLRQRHIRPQ